MIKFHNDTHPMKGSYLQESEFWKALNDIILAIETMCVEQARNNGDVDDYSITSHDDQICDFVGGIRLEEEVSSFCDPSETA